MWKYVIEFSGEQYLRCKFCNQRCARGVNRLKHHLAGTHHGMKPCPKVSEDVRLECKDALANFKDQKTKRNELLQEIGMGPTSMHECLVQNNWCLREWEWEWEWEWGTYS